MNSSVDTKTKINNLKVVHIYNFYKQGMGYIENNLPIEESKWIKNILILISRDDGLCFKEYESDKIDQDINIETVSYIRSHLIGQIKLIFKFQPNIVFPPYLHPIIIPLVLFKPLLKYKIISTIGMPINVDKLSRPQWLLYHVFLLISKSYLSNRVDLFVECTSANVNRDMSIFKIASNNIMFSPLGCDKNRFQRDGNIRNLIRKELDISPEESVFIYAGKLIPEKNIHLLIDAFIKISQSIPKVKLILLGNGPESYESSIESKIQENHLNNVIWINFLPNSDLPKYYNAADIGIWPGSPSITIQEAMGCGLPIIIKNSNHTNHLLKYGNGYGFDNAEQLCNFMETLAKDRCLRLKMGDLSRKLVETELNWEVIAYNLVEMYMNLYSTKAQ